MKRDWYVISDTIHDHETYTKALVRNGVNSTGTHVDTTMERDWYVIFDTIYDHDTYTKAMVRNGVNSTGTHVDTTMKHAQRLWCVMGLTAQAPM